MGKNLTIALCILLSLALSFGAVKLYQIHQLEALQAELAVKAAYEAELARTEEERARNDALQKRHEKLFAPIELNRNVDTSDTVKDLMNW